MNDLESITLAPMSAGDIIDRAIRLYRQNFIALLRIVLPPSLLAYSGVIIYYLGVRNFTFDRGDARIALTALLVFAGGILWFLGKAAFYAVLGAASKTLVNHFFDGTPIRAIDVYRGLRERFWSLVGAGVLVFMLVIGVVMLIYFLVVILVLIFTFAATQIGGHLPRWAQITAAVIFTTGVSVSVLLIMLMTYSRIIYVPQVLMVEGKSAASAISRSFSLAGGEVRRIGAIMIFWFYVAWSLWILLMIPLGWYGYWSGVDITPFGAEVPFWYSVTQQTIVQISEILIAPIAMLAFTLLYIDSRVRKEGFDVELTANRVLPPPNYLATPVIEHRARVESSFNFSTPPRASSQAEAVIPGPPAPSTPEESMDDSTSFDRIAVDPDLISDESVQPPVAVEERQPEVIAERPSADETSAQVAAAGPQIKSCRWCESDADVDDRFCKVCGSVF
ncbi:MAG: hypothetical protein IPJ07_08450 [Acidobacteria bacterium]|nr:hypothetical protein [Acidobacteriota bacterium]